MNAVIQIMHQAASGKLTADEKVVGALIEEIIEEILPDNHLVTYVNLFNVDRHDWIGKVGVIFYPGQCDTEKIIKDLQAFQEALRHKNAEGVRTWVFERGNRQYPIILIKKPKSSQCISYSERLKRILLEVEASDNGAAELSKALGLSNAHTREVQWDTESGKDGNADRDFKEIFSYLRERHFLKDQWQFIYYFVSPVSRQRAVSGASIFVKKAIPEDKLIQLAASLDVLFAHLDLILIEGPLRRHALRSAVAAIMARNMSHIHGSHIEPGLQHRMFTFEKLIRDRVGG
jgi:hypothetical protein